MSLKYGLMISEVEKMTLDEAIRHCEEVADVCEFEASKYDMTDAYESHVGYQESKCANEHRQLARWLTLLKQILDSGDCNNCACKKDCSEVTKPGELVRYNCYAYVNRAIQEN